MRILASGSKTYCTRTNGKASLSALGNQVAAKVLHALVFVVVSGGVRLFLINGIFGLGSLLLRGIACRGIVRSLAIGEIRYNTDSRRRDGERRNFLVDGGHVDIEIQDLLQLHLNVAALGDLHID